MSSQGVCGSDLIDHREHEAAAEASHKMRCAFGQQSGGCFFSVEVCVFSCCLTCPIRHGATQTCTRTRTRKTQSLSTLRHSQLSRRNRSKERAWSPKRANYSGHSRASRGGPEGSSRARGFLRCLVFLASRSIACEVRATERQQTWHH